METHGTDLESISRENLLEIQYQFGRAFRRMPNKRAEALLGNKKNMQKLLQKISKDLEITLVNEAAMLQIPNLIRFYKEVLDLDRPSIAELAFPEHDVFQTFMPIGLATNHDEIMEAYAAKRKIKTSGYKTPIASNIDPKSAEKSGQKRPSGIYVIAHLDGDEPDQKHLGKSYDNSVAEGLNFANSIEYLLMTGFRQFVKGSFMDVKGWTRTSDLWSDGYLVSGCWSPDDSRLCLDDGNRSYRLPGRGPRELVFS